MFYLPLLFTINYEIYQFNMKYMPFFWTKGIHISCLLIFLLVFHPQRLSVSPLHGGSGENIWKRNQECAPKPSQVSFNSYMHMIMYKEMTILLKNSLKTTTHNCLRVPAWSGRSCPAILARLIHSSARTIVVGSVCCTSRLHAQLNRLKWGYSACIG